MSSPIVITTTIIDSYINQYITSDKKIQYILISLESLGISSYMYGPGDRKYSLPIETMMKSLSSKYLLDSDSQFEQLQSEEIEQEYQINENINLNDLLEIDYIIEDSIS